MLKNIPKKYLPLVFLVGLVVLILFQNKAIMPLVESIAASGLFMEDSGDEGSRSEASSDMTNYAFNQCNQLVREEIDSETNILFPTEPLHSWKLGNFKYIINAEIEVTANNGSSSFKKYACQIQYDNKGNLEGVADKDNWTLNGLSGLSDI